MLEKVAAIIREQLNQENVEITEATRFKEGSGSRLPGSV